MLTDGDPDGDPLVRGTVSSSRFFVEQMTD